MVSKVSWQNILRACNHTGRFEGKKVFQQQKQQQNNNKKQNPPPPQKNKQKNPMLIFFPLVMSKFVIYILNSTSIEEKCLLIPRENWPSS